MRRPCSPTSKGRAPPSRPGSNGSRNWDFHGTASAPGSGIGFIPFLEAGGWQALDLSGDERAQPIETFQPLYRECKARGMRLKAHVGEWGTADDVWRAVEVLELDEVQHEMAAEHSPPP